MATVQFQLSDNVKGGSTVFPNQGIAVPISEGSLLFWYNLETFGGRADESLHGSCPTLYGIQWGKAKEFISNTIFLIGLLFQFPINGYERGARFLNDLANYFYSTRK